MRNPGRQPIVRIVGYHIDGRFIDRKYMSVSAADRMAKQMRRCTYALLRPVARGDLEWALRQENP